MCALPHLPSCLSPLYLQNSIPAIVPLLIPLPKLQLKIKEHLK